MPEVLQTKFINTDIRVYWTKLATIGIGTQTFTYRVGLVPQLDCGVLIRKDCPILAQLLWKAPLSPPPRTGEGTAGQDLGVEFLVQRDEIAHLTGNDSSLQFAKMASREQHPPQPQTRCQSLPWPTACYIGGWK